MWWSVLCMILFLTLATPICYHVNLLMVAATPLLDTFYFSFQQIVDTAEFVYVPVWLRRRTFSTFISSYVPCQDTKSSSSYGSLLNQHIRRNGSISTV